MNSFIITVLTSSVIATVLSVIGNVLSDRRKNSLEYITKERSIWREDIRAIAEEISASDEETIHKALTKLQVRINAYDRFLNNNHADGDQFIWMCIELCENIKEKDALNVIKKNLLVALSLMLKYDWERSKEEVKGNINVIKITLGSLFQILVFILLIPILDMPLPLVAVLIWSYVFLELIENTTTTKLNEITIKDKKIDTSNFLIIFWVISFLLTLMVFTVSKNTLLQTLNLGIVGKIFGAITCMMPSSLTLIFKLENSMHSKSKISYLKSLNKLYEEMDNAMKQLSNEEQGK